MTRDSITSGLTIVFFGLCLTIGVLTYRHNQMVQELAGIQSRVNAMQQRQRIANALGNDLLAYSQHNPAINPLLQSVGLKPAPAPAAAPRTPAPAAPKGAKK